MRFEEAAARLARLSEPAAALGQAQPWALPAAPAALMPVFTDGRPRAEIRLELAPGDRPAAVLVLVAPDRAGQAAVILTERATYEGLHSGEVSFPGGKVEPGDADLESTALREATEEVGLDPVAVGLEVVGRLDVVRIPVSRFRLTPILAVGRSRPILQAAPAEVARIIEAPLEAILPEAPIEVVERRVRDWPLRYGGYRIDGLHVWGATARILGQLGALVAELGASSPE
jgi:8-oxo-dGTP pyrophosphatase MutT (NUDIX family)